MLAVWQMSFYFPIMTLAENLRGEVRESPRKMMCLKDPGLTFKMMFLVKLLYQFCNYTT